MLLAKRSKFSSLGVLFMTMMLIISLDPERGRWTQSNLFEKADEKAIGLGILPRAVAVHYATQVLRRLLTLRYRHLLLNAGTCMQHSAPVAPPGEEGGKLPPMGGRPKIM